MSGGRPTKINDEVLKAFDEIVNDGINAIILTDDELVFLVNEKLEAKDKFSYSSFQRWKALMTKDETDISEEEEKYLDKYADILGLIKKALITQKNNLFTELKNDKQTWTKWAWIIERKFDDWNLRIKSENKNDTINKVEVEIISPNNNDSKDKINKNNDADESQSIENNN